MSKFKYFHQILSYPNITFWPVFEDYPCTISAAELKV